MLSIGKLGRGQENYYLAVVAKGIEDYYTGRGEVAGEWLGAAAARLGLAGPVDSEQLRGVLAGTDPRSGDRLGGHTRSDRVPGWDLTFSAPKSVSVLYALGGTAVAAEVVAAHREAVVAGLRYLERHAVTSRRRVDGDVELVRAEGLVAAAFRHRTSRAGDPQLHTHCLAANVVERVDGGWGALYSPIVYRHARTAGFVYHAVLRAELTDRLGVAWGDIRNGHAEIDGIDRRLLDRFSKRRHEIEAAMAERGEKTMAASRTAALETRRAKDYGVDPQTLTERWVAEAAELGVTPSSMRHLLGHRPPRVTSRALDEIAERLTGPHGLTAEDASFDHRDVVRAWCSRLPLGAQVGPDGLEELADGFVEDDRVVPVVDGRDRLAARQIVRDTAGEATTAVAVDRRWSTADMLSVEARLLDRSARSRGVGAGQVDNSSIEAYLAHRSSLSEEQAAMVRALCASGHGVEVVVGRAGTGKTYALAAAAVVWRRSRYRPVGVALAARAAAELETTAGIPSTTVAQFLKDCEQAPRYLSDRHVVVVDEAAMVDTRRLDRIVAYVEAAGAKVVLVGDHHQLPSVEAGGVLRGLVARHDAIELTENRRQVEEWERATLAKLRAGRGRHSIVEVVARYDGRGRLHVGASPADIRAAMVADWYDARSDGEQAVMLALRRADVAELNERARALLVADGAVAPTGATVAGTTFAAGDRVVCLHNDRRVGVHNALFGTVTAAGRDGVVVQTEDSGQMVMVPTWYIADGHLDHAYATTIHKSQGATYDRALLLGDERLYRQAGYTALSRGRVRNDLYMVTADERDVDVELEPHGRAEPDGPQDRLARTLARDGAKRLATDERIDPGLRQSAVPPLAALWRERDAIAAHLANQADSARGVGSAVLVADTSDQRARLAALDRAVERRAELAGHAAEIDRPSHIVRALGEPPTDLEGRARWRAAATAIESYAARWAEHADLTANALDALPLAQTRDLAEVRAATARVVSPGLLNPLQIGDEA